MRVSKVRFSLVFVGVFIFGLSVYSQQPGEACQSYDPVMDPDWDPFGSQSLCCDENLSDTVLTVKLCYDVSTLQSSTGTLDRWYLRAYMPFVGLVLNYLYDPILENDYEYISFADLATQMTFIYGNLCQNTSNCPALIFQYDAVNMKICADTYVEGFDTLVLYSICNYDSLDLVPVCPYYLTAEKIIDTTIILQECPISEPDISGLLGGGDPEVPSNYVLLSTADGETVTTTDIQNSPSISTNNPSMSGPSSSQVAYLFYQAVESGVLQNGMGCFNWNCVDLQSMAAAYNQGFVADSLNALASEAGITNDVPNGQTFSEFMSDAAGEAVSVIEDAGGLSSFLNAYFDWNLPDMGPCMGEDMMSMDLSGSYDGNGGFSGEGGNYSEKSGKAGKGSKVLQVNQETSADVNYFSGNIAGLGQGGGEVSAPSPGAQKMIDQINAGVNLYNGAATVSVPLYTVQANDISLPISISGGGNGLTVDDLGSLLGENWQLEVGAMITRVVNDLPDEFLGVIKGQGAGKNYKPRFLFQMPSRVGLNVNIKTVAGNSLVEKIEELCAGLVGCPKKEIAFPGILVQLYEGVENAEGSAFKIDLHWTPMNANVISISFSVPVYCVGAFGVNICFSLSFSIDLGVEFVEVPGPVSFEEYSLGYKHLSDASALATLGNILELPEPLWILSAPGIGGMTEDIEPFGLDDMSFNDVIWPSDVARARQLMRYAHTMRRWTDAEFLNDQQGGFSTFLAWVSSLDSAGYSYRTKHIDTEPDEYHFNIGGYSGWFSFNVDGDPVIFPDQELQIEPKYTVVNGQEYLSSFVITTPDGMRYTFGDTEHFYGVDWIVDTSYYLPNYYTYPEIDEGPGRDFVYGQAVKNRRVIEGPLKPAFLSKVFEYDDIYVRNYRMTARPRYTSAWHLVKVESLLSREEVSLSYVRRDDLSYYSSKTLSHTFPNFDVDETTGNLITKENTDLNGYHPQATKWETGLAEFSYTAVQTTLTRWDLVGIHTQRAEDVYLFYEVPRAEIAGDYLCNRIEVHRNGQMYKGWLFDYGTVGVADSEVVCNEMNLNVAAATEPAASIDGEWKFNLGISYEVKKIEYNNYLFLNLNLFGCLNVPVRFSLPFQVNHEDLGGNHTVMSEYGSLAMVKDLLGIYNEDREQAIFNAEHKRTFLQGVHELGKTYDGQNGIYDFITHIEYYEGVEQMPKRYSTDQDVFGYWVDNSASGSPLPALSYTSVFGNEVTSAEPGLSKHYGFWRLGMNANAMLLGHKAYPELPEDESRIKAGSIKRIELATGASISYTYEAAELPGEGSCGLRVSSMTQDPYDQPAKTTYYSYGGSTVVNAPVRIYQTKINNHYVHPGADFSEDEFYESRVRSTAKPQNKLFPNGGGHVGYTEVEESWGGTEGEGIGRVQHYYTGPQNYQPHFLGAATPKFFPGFEANVKKYRLKRSSWLPGQGNFDVVVDADTLPSPSLYFPEGYIHVKGVLGSEYRTETYAASGEMVQLDQYRYLLYGLHEGNLHYNPKYLYYFKSEMYQNNFPGTFPQSYGSRLLAANKRFIYNLLLCAASGGNGTDEAYYELLDLLVNLIEGGVIAHPFKRVMRYYQVADYKIPTYRVSLLKETQTRFYEGGSNSVVKTYRYKASNTQKTSAIPHEVVTEFSDGYVVREGNIFLDGSSSLLNYFDENALLYLQDSIDYRMPVASITIVDTVLQSVNLTALGLENLGGENKIVPISNWEVRGGALCLKGKFAQYNVDGKPQRYYLAKHGADDNSDIGDSIYFFAPIRLSWNQQLQLKKRSYLDFSTTYQYNNYFELYKLVNPDSLISRYGYDARGRLVYQENMLVASDPSLPALQTVTYDYVIGPGVNAMKATTTFSDDTPAQEATQYTDGFGRLLKVVRNNDGAVLESHGYDNFFREILSAKLSTGVVTTAYEASPQARWIEYTDAVGNVTRQEQDVSNAYFNLSRVIDANGSISESHTDGLGRLRKTINGVGEIDAVTTYAYDTLSRLVSVVNPVGEVYEYTYNELDKLSVKKIPGSSPMKIWWDKAFRPVAIEKANGYVELLSHDDYNRIRGVYDAQPSLTLGSSTEVLPEGSLEVYWGDTLMFNSYYEGHTWLKQTGEVLLTSSGLGAMQYTDFDVDIYGRADSVTVQTPYGQSLSMTTQYNAAGLILQTKSVLDSPEAMSVVYDFAFDDVLRPISTSMDLNNSGSVLLSLLDYNSRDLLKTKYLGGAGNNAFLQKVDYLYDAAGKLVQINTPGEAECFLADGICNLQGQVSIKLDDPFVECFWLHSVEIEGQDYPLDLPQNFGSGTQAESAAQFLDSLLNVLLEANGLIGEVKVVVEVTDFKILYKVRIVNTTTDAVVLHFANEAGSDCLQEKTLDLGSCCDPNLDLSYLNGAVPYSPNEDLFYEKLTYTGLNITTIEMSGDCQVGLMRNDFTYDALHRLTAMNNQLLGENPVQGAYNTTYSYDAAGNIQALTRYGMLEDPSGSSGTAVYAQIDELSYTYEATKPSVLAAVSDGVADPAAQPLGFGKLSPSSVYEYDGAGNLIKDSGKDLQIAYNSLNLPRRIWRESTGEQMLIDYTYGGSKLRTQTHAADGTVEERLYLGGFEFVTDSASGALTVENYQHPEGRVVFDADSIPHYQYRIADHLGNTVVFFEDKNGDGLISSEQDTDDPELLEVLQRQYYYPFGLAMSGTWLSQTTPLQRYLYNGKELHGELGLEWLDYGARYYDAAIGRWGQIDPKVSWYYGMSPYNYAGNSPIVQYDPNGEFIGTLIGAVVGGVRAYRRGENVWAGIGKGALAGAMADLAAAAVITTAGTAGPLVLAAAGAAEGFVGSLVDQGLEIASGYQERVNWGEVGVSVGLGVVGGFAAGKIFRGALRKGDIEVGELSKGKVVDSKKISGGKAKNKLKPDENAKGDHTTFARDDNGDIFKYETYKKTKTGYFDPQKRFDGGKPDGSPGSAHKNSKTGEYVPTPHVNGKKIPGGVRSVKPNEIPNNKRFNNG